MYAKHLKATRFQAATAAEPPSEAEEVEEVATVPTTTAQVAEVERELVEAQRMSGYQRAQQAPKRD